jgi:tetratricopeptide (TPR) repeat protein
MALFTKQFLSFVLLSIFLAACDLESETVLKKKAEQQETSGSYKKAIDSYEKIINIRGKNQESVSYAKAAANLALIKTKDYERALKLFRYVILHSEDPTERLAAQKNIAEIHFTHLATPDYAEAIKEISKLLSLKLNDEERVEYHTNLARAYYRANNFYQAQVEIDQVLKETKDKTKQYDLKRLKADIFLSSKDQQNAVNIYVDLLKQYPELAKRDDIGLSLAVSYEDQEKYDKAIEVLTGLKKDSEKPEYLDLRIKRLRERLAQQPGARGLRK